MATNNALNVNAVTPLLALYGGTGLSNPGTFTVGGNTAFSGAFTFTGTVTANTAVTFPTSGTLATTAQTITWSSATGSQTADVNNGYVVTSGTPTITLPSTAALGAIVAVQGFGAGGWVLKGNTGQTIRLGTSVTSSAGTLTSANQYDAIEVVCVVANTTWATRFVLSAGLTVA